MKRPTIAVAAALALTGYPAWADGPVIPLSDAVRAEAPVRFEVWQWGADPAMRRKILDLRDGQRIAASALPRTGIQFQFRVPVPHDSVICMGGSSDGPDRLGWGPEKVTRHSAGPQPLYHVLAEFQSLFPQVGRYRLSAEATDGGRPVARGGVTFDIVGGLPPRNTRYLWGRKDSQGNPITVSAPVPLGGLNETPVLKDNDYAFEPQRAFNVVNWERFPPFHLPERFLAVWASQRFSDEEQFGGPLDRGFTATANLRPGQDNLPIRQRVWFHTPDAQVAFIHDWYRKDAVKYADLEAYADYRSAFVSADNAYKLGWACYESWGAGGYAPYDAGLYGWDEEQMWPTIAAKLRRDHPELLPERLRQMKDTDPRLADEYVRAWGDFIANTYRGARACAAGRGRTLKIWHYGSKAPGDYLFLGRDDANVNPATGRYRADEPGALWPWFKTGDKVDFAASEYSRQIDYFNKDFYYLTLFPQTSSLYEKDAAGQYALDPKGRRRFRRDVFEERLYAAPVKIGYEDCETSPVFLKAFLAKGENALFWLNGGHYYKHHGTLVTPKQLIPTLRPGNQETWGDSAKLGSRPISPYMAEASTIYTFMMGLEGLYLWDSRNYTGPAGSGANGKVGAKETLGDLEFTVKGMHRVSQFNALFQGHYDFVRPVRHYDTWNHDHPLIRGIVNGRYLLLAMTNPYLDPEESQAVELRYGTPFESGTKPVWSGTVRLLSRRTHLFQCKLPPLPGGQTYDPDKLYFRYTCADGSFRKTFTVSGDYEAPYPEVSAQGDNSLGAKH